YARLFAAIARTRSSAAEAPLMERRSIVEAPARRSFAGAHDRCDRSRGRSQRPVTGLMGSPRADLIVCIHTATGLWRASQTIGDASGGCSDDTAMLRGVLFDLDGVLIDSLPSIHASLCHALAAVGRPTIDRARARPLIGPPLIESARA